MPRSGPPTYTYTLPPVYLAIPGTTILVAQHNDPLEDIASTFNSAQPVVWGGTGATTVAGAKANLGFLYQSWGAYPTAGGTANALTLTPTDALLALTSGTPMTLTGLLPNTGAATLDVSGLGAKAIRKMGAATDVALYANDIQVGWRYDLVYDSTANSAAGAWILVNASNVGPYSPGTLWGATISNGTDATNDINVAIGSMRSSDDTANIDLSSAMGKQADVAWASGGTPSVPAGGRFFTTLVNGTLHFYVIKNPSTGAVDAGFSDNASDPTGGANYPSGYTKYRRIGSIVRTGGAIKAFVQVGDEFLWSAYSADISANNPGTSAVTRTLTIPTGIVGDAIINATLTNTGAGTSSYCYISSLAVTDEAPSSTTLSIFGNALNATGGSVVQGGVLSVRTNTSAQVRSRLSFSDANVTLRINTLGWRDSRGSI